MAKENAKKSKRGINALDVVIVLLVICLLGTVGYRIYKGVSDPDINKESKYIVEYSCDGVYNSLADYIERGDAIYFAKNGERLGHAYLGKEDTHVLMNATEDKGGEEVESGTEAENAEEPVSYDKVSATGKLKLNADALYQKNGNIYEIGDISIAVGSVIEVYTVNTVFTITVTNIYAVE